MAGFRHGDFSIESTGEVAVVCLCEEMRAGSVDPERSRVQFDGAVKVFAGGGRGEIEGEFTSCIGRWEVADGHIKVNSVGLDAGEVDGDVTLSEGLVFELVTFDGRKTFEWSLGHLPSIVDLD